MATVPFAINVFMRSHIEVLSAEYDVTLVTSGRPAELAELLGPHVRFISLPFERKPSIWKDARALFQLWRLLRRERFDAVHSIMPKSGLLSMLAARLTAVPVRMHTFTGQVWATRTGLRRRLLRLLDRLLVMNATRVLADSHSQRLFLIENGVAKASHIDVLADGSVAGVDLHRFSYSAAARDRIRQHLGIPEPAVVFLFLGRLTRDKGLAELSQAFVPVSESHTAAHLLVVGPDEEGLEGELAALGERCPGRLHRAGFAERPQEYMSAADVLCLPSHREGFGSVIIEAASVGLPAIASRIYGVVDAVEDGVTGILHQPGNVGEMTRAMSLLAADGDRRRRMGAVARERVSAKFSKARVTRALADCYREMLAGISARVPRAPQ